MKQHQNTLLFQNSNCHHLALNFPSVLLTSLSLCLILKLIHNRFSGVVGGKTGKTSVLPGISIIEHGGGVLHCYGGLAWAHSPRGAAEVVLMRTYKLVEHRSSTSKDKVV